MNKITIIFISGIVGLLFGLITEPIIIKELSFFNASSQLGSLFSFIWISLFVLAGLVVGYKMTSKD